MAYSRETLPKDHGEFSGGPGLIDPEVRKDRVALTNEQLHMEMMFTNPDPPEVAHGNTDEEIQARAGQIQEENDPAKVPLPRIIVTE